MARSLLIAGLLTTLALPLPAADMTLSLRFTPKENITSNAPAADRMPPSTPIDVKSLVDARSGDLRVVGENREHSIPRFVRATSSLSDFATDVLKRSLSEWGAHVGPGVLVLKGEIANLLVTEEQTYSTAVNVRFRLEDSTGKVLWEGVAVGDAHQWGRSYGQENYNEEISDALKRTYANLVSNEGLQDSWNGRSAGERHSTISPAEAKAKILEMMKAGIGTETIASYIYGVRLSPPLGSEEILEWKKAGIAEEVIRAALTVR